VSKVKLMVDPKSENTAESTTELYKSLAEFFSSRGIEFEITVANDVEVVIPAKQSTTKAAEVLQDFSDIKTGKKLEERISNIFITVGIPAHIKGYQFLREAVKLTIEKPEIINSITKQLYPTIAKKFKTSASKVERAIRHAIEVGWNRGRVENINNAFGVRAFDTKDKPTNGEFIAIVADKMILEGA